ncbi:MAG TPA: LysR family transcriptional regulator [Nannocystis sp.]
MTTNHAIRLHGPSGLGKVAAFVAVVESGSFTAAAEELGLPKSSVSRGITRLEEELGVRLLHRTTRRLHLTDAGTAFYHKARSALAALEEAAHVAADLGHEPRGTVRVTAPVDLGEFMAEPLVRFSRMYPQIEVDLVLTARLIDLVREGFDMAIRATRLKDSSLVARKLGTFADGLYAAPSYLKRRGTPATLADLAHHECLLFRARGGRSTWVLRRGRSEEHVDVRGSLSADDFSFIVHAAEAGAGIAFLPHVLVARPVAARKLVRILPEYSFTRSDLAIVLPTARHVPTRVALLRDFLAGELRPLLLAAQHAGAASPRN